MILLTGASGFIGGHLLNALLAKYGRDKVVALTSKHLNGCNYLLHNNYSFHSDFFINEGYSEIETIIHAGAFIPKSVAESNDINGSFSNIFTTNQLIKSDIPKLKKIIFLSTVDVYGDDSPINEKSPVVPVSLYGHSKLYSENAISHWASQKNLKYQILRIGHVYGPGEEKYKKLIPVVIRQLLNDQPINISGTGEELRTFIYISDVVNSIIHSIEHESNLEIINVVGNLSVSIKKLIDKVIDLTGKTPVINQIKSDNKPRDLIFDNKNLTKFYQPEITLEEGLRLEIEYFKSL